MSHTFPALSLDVRSDEAFESQIRAQAQRRLRQAHEHRAHQHSRTASTSRIAFETRDSREKARASKWKRAASAVALAAFAAGLLWPVASAPEPDSGEPQPSRLVRVVHGELLASLDAPVQHAR